MYRLFITTFCAIFLASGLVSGGKALGLLRKVRANPDAGTIGPCPDGVSIVFCLVDPCQFSLGCPAYPQAECVSNYCGGCSADYYVGNQKVDCALPVCPKNKPQVDCSNSDVCAVNNCPSNPGAVCEIDDCGECKAQYYLNGEKIDCQCPKKEPAVECLVDPCETTSCPAYPDARCSRSACGGCFADYYLDGNKVDCALTTCPEKKGQVNCFVDPCDFSTCSAHPEAQCIPNYCGGCNAEYFVDGQQVDCDCHDVLCSEDPCTFSICPIYPNAVCRTKFDCNYCGAAFYIGKQEIDCNVCPPDLPQVRCFADPCTVNTCEAYPNARCESNYCGGCNAVFYNESEIVDCLPRKG